jgi:hypothetical protein
VSVPPPSGPDRRTAAAGCLAAAVVVVAVLEVFSFFALSAARREWFTWGRLHGARAAVAAGADSPAAAAAQGPAQPGFFVEEVVHPYLGFVLDRSFSRCRQELAGYRDALEYGFHCSEFPMLQRRSPDKVVVGLLGGSVAYAFPALGLVPLREELERSGRLAGRSLVLLPMALPGYKQPQQLMTLTYFLALGAEFDLVINLDGFNDIVLPAVENVPKGVFPFFPRSWYFRVGALDLETRARMGEVAYVRSRRAAHARWFSHAPLRFSTTASLLWTLLDRLDTARISAVQSRLLKQRDAGGAYVQTGPERRYPDEAAMYADLADGWRQSSLQLHRLAAANGAVYEHFLQPNQYVPGSKPFGDEERKRALADTFGFRHSVEAGYPLLQAAGRELAGHGVRFHDMTQVFAGDSRPLYVDACCHFDVTGYDSLARAMARAIVADTAPAEVRTARR